MKKVIVNTKDKNGAFNFDQFSVAIVEDDGAIKWESNGSYLMRDTMELIIDNGFCEFSPEATEKKREQQLAEFFAEYRKHSHQPSAEQLAEMRSAYAPGTRVVDVITGEVTII